MKKTLILASLTMALGLFASQAFAYGPGLGGGGYGCPYWNGTEEDAAKYQEYLDQTKDLRAALDADITAYRELMAQDEPDPAKAGELAGSITKNKIALQNKAQEMGLETRGRGGCPGYGPGAGNRGCGYRGGAGGDLPPCCRQ